MKKLLSSLLVLALVLTMALPAFAAPATDVVGTDYEDAVAQLSALGIINGYEDGTFRPENDITRAEFAKIIVVASGNESNAKFLAGTSAYKDVKGTEWFAGYVAAAATLGLVKGYEDGTFRPNNNITTQEVVTVVLRALGYNDELPGNWPYDYLIKANSLGLFAGLDITATAKANRGLVAQLTANSLVQEVVTFNTVSKQFDGTGNYFVENVNDGFYTAVVTAPGLDSQGRISLNDILTKFAEDAYVGDVELGQNVLLLVNADDEIIYLTPGLNKVVVGTMDATIDGKLTVDKVAYNLATAPAGDIFYNNAAQADLTLVDAAGVTVKAFLGANDVVRFVVAEDYDVSGIVASVTSNSRYQMITLEDASSFKVALDVDLSNVKAGNVVYAKLPGGVSNTDAYEVLVVADQVTGLVTKMSNANFTINGTVYTDLSGQLSASSLGKTYTVTLDKDGKIVKAVIATDGTAAPTVQGFVKAVEEYTTLVDNKLVSRADITVFTVDGKEVTYKTDVVDVDDMATFSATSEDTTVTNEIAALNLTTATKLYTFTFNTKGELALVASPAAPVTLTNIAAPATIAADGVVGNLVKTDGGNYYVTANTKIFFVNYAGGTLNVTAAGQSSVKSLSDLKPGMKVAYATSGVNFTYVVVTNATITTGLADVNGFFVSATNELVYNPVTKVNDNVYTVTLNVNGVNKTYTVEGDLTSDPAAVEGNFVTLSDFNKNDAYELLADNTLSLADFVVDSTNKLFAVDGTLDNDYIVTSSTVVLVKTVDANGDFVYTVGSFSDIVNAANGEVVLDTYNAVVLDSNVFIGTHKIATFVVIEDLN